MKTTDQKPDFWDTSLGHLIALIGIVALIAFGTWIIYQAGKDGIHP